MSILVISISSLEHWNEKNGTDLAYNELTDEQFLYINSEYDDFWHFDTLAEFVAEFNEDGAFCPYSGEHYIRVFND